MTQNQHVFLDEGTINLPSSDDSPISFQLLWDGCSVTWSDFGFPAHFTKACQETLKSHVSLTKVVSTELIDDIEKSGFSKIPSVRDPYTSGHKSPMWGDRINSTSFLVWEKSKVELSLQENWHVSNPTEEDIKLCEKMAVKTIAKPLLGDLAAKLNKQVTEGILRFVNSVGNLGIDEIFRQNSEGNHDRFRGTSRSYRTEAKAMFHPGALRLIPAPKFVGREAWENASEQAPLCLNWDMPEPAANSAEVLVGDFSQLMLILKPIEITLTGGLRLWELEAETEALCGIWSAVSPSLVRATVPVQQ